MLLDDDMPSGIDIPVEQDDKGDDEGDDEGDYEGDDEGDDGGDDDDDKGDDDDIEDHKKDGDDKGSDDSQNVGKDRGGYDGDSEDDKSNDGEGGNDEDIDEDIEYNSRLCLKNPTDASEQFCINYDDFKKLYELKDNLRIAGPPGPLGPQGPPGPMGPIKKNPEYNYKIIENGMIKGENAIKLSYISSNDCSSVCDKAEWCKSFDYNQEYESCNLSSANRDTSKILSSTKYTYYEKAEKK